MSLVWNPGAIPGLLALVTATSMAALVLWTQPGRSQNRRLALLLALDGLGLGALGGLFLATSEPTAAGLSGIVAIEILLQPWTYLAFLATLDTPLVDRLDSPAATSVIAVCAGVSVASYVPFRHLIVGGGPLRDAGFIAGLLVALFGLVVAASLYRETSPGSARRSSARAYLAAFGLRDILNGAAFVYILLLAEPGHPRLLTLAMGTWLPQITSILFALLLAYGILKTQLFDIDLKIKWTLEKSTVAAIFVAVFFAVSEGAQVLFADFAGNELLGVAAAALLVFFLAPLQRLADQVGDRVMPGVEDTEEYRQERKRQIYRAQLEELMADEQITAKERSALLRLQEDLGLEAETANRIEADVIDGSAGGGP